MAVMYHRIGPRAGDPARELVPALSAVVFEAQVRHLLGHYRVVPASKLLQAVTERRRGERFPAALTFDDDLRSHVEVATPVLRRLGAPATFFLCGASLEAPFAFWWERLQAAAEHGLVDDAVLPAAAVSSAELADRPEAIHELGLAIEALEPGARDELARELGSRLGADPPGSGLRAEHVRALADDGFEIGFHTLRHHGLLQLDDRDLACALGEGRDALAEAAGSPLKVIAYPHGKAHARTGAAAAAAGYAYGFTTHPEPLTAATDPMLLPRVEAPFDSAGRLAARLVRLLVRAD